MSVVSTGAEVITGAEVTIGACEVVVAVMVEPDDTEEGGSVS